MKLYNKIILAILACCSLTVSAQDFDTKPVLSTEVEGVKLSVGGRFMGDAAFYSYDSTPMNSGATISDARIRAALEYQDWYFYADFGFAGGEFSQKNIFLKYTMPNSSVDANHSFKAGYYAEPNSMSRIGSIYSSHFIARSSNVYALGEGRSLGLTYKFYNPLMTLTQGVFAESKYNDQISGFQGVAASGRWVARPISTGDQVLHIGVNARFAQLNTGEMVNDIKKTHLNLSAPLATYVDDRTDFLNAELPWAKNVTSVGAEFLYLQPKVFIRGEYAYKHVSKKRPDELLFINQLGGQQSWTTLESWQAGNPLKSNSFSGMHIEAGYKIFGDNYQYDYEEAVLKGNGERSLEIVARFSHTNLNDIAKGDIFVPGRNQFYPNGVITDYPPVSTSIGGGRINSATFGVNYTFNRFAQVMVDYTYSHMNNFYKSMDKDVHTLQGRVMFNF